MARYFASILIACCVAAGLNAQELRVPPQPAKSAIPKHNSSGERVRGIAFPATAAFRMTDGTAMLMYGYIVGAANGTSNFFFWNTNEAAECSGTTYLVEGGFGDGAFSCSRGGARLLEGPFRVIPSKYRKRRGSVEASFVEETGVETQVMLAWQPRRFPYVQPMVDALWPTR